MSAAFDAACEVEAQGMRVLLQYIERASDGRYVLTSKGPLSRHLQLIVGDVVMNSRRNGDVMGVEVKCEAENRYRNLYIETWSNKNLDHRLAHAEHGVNRGWLDHSRADWLFYYFIRQDELYIIDFFALKQWAFGKHGEPGRIYDFPEKAQGKYHQANKTHGRCVPIHVLARELGEQAFFPVRATQLAFGFAQARFELGSK